MDDADDWKRDLWSQRTREQLLQQGAAAVEALQAHLAVLDGSSGDEDVPAIEESAERLDSALGALRWAQFDFSSVTAPLGMFGNDDWDDDDDHDDDDDDLDEATYRYVSVLLRRNYQVLSDTELLAAGRAAHAGSRSDDPPAETVRRVSTAGHALYEVMHAHGLKALNDVPGLTPTDGVALYVGRQEPQTVADDTSLMIEDPMASFTLDGELLFLSSDHWS